VAVLKVADAVCLDISWGRWSTRASWLLLAVTSFRRAAGCQHLFFASFMSGWLNQLHCSMHL
jgi:hypothetical protein